MNRRRFVPIVISLLLINLAARAQTYIFGRADFAVGSVPTSIASGDFNGDGITDFGVTNSNDNTVSILLGKPDGTFAPQVAYATGAEPVAVVTGISTATAIWTLRLPTALAHRQPNLLPGQHAIPPRLASCWETAMVRFSRISTSQLGNSLPLSLPPILMETANSTWQLRTRWTALCLCCSAMETGHSRRRLYIKPRRRCYTGSPSSSVISKGDGKLDLAVTCAGQSLCPGWRRSRRISP